MDSWPPCTCSAALVVLALGVRPPASWLLLAWSPPQPDDGLHYHCRAGAHTCPPFRGNRSAAEGVSYQHRANGTLVNQAGAAIQRRLEMRRRAGSSLSILTVGANTLEHDLSTYAIYATLEPQPLMVFVEPHPRLQAPLREQLQGIGATRTQLVEAAVCAEDSSSATLYVVSERSPSQANNYGWAHPSQSSSLSWDRVNMSDPGFVEALAVRCITPSRLLEEANLEPGGVDVLHIDAESWSLKLLDLFLRIELFAPATIGCEWVLEMSGFGQDDTDRLITSLARRGYEVAQDGVDLVAIADGGSAAAVRS